MQYEVQRVNDIKRVLRVKVSPEELTTIENDIINDLKKHVALPGFRKGRAPVGMLRKSYKDVIQKEVIEKAISKYYTEALDKADLSPIGQGQISNLAFTDAKTEMEFDIEIEVQPEIELKKYKGLHAEQEAPVVTDAMLNDTLHHFQEHYATVQSVDKAEKGHIINVTLQELGEGGLPIVGRKFEDITIELGAGNFDPELEEQLIGIREDQERIIRKQIEGQPDQETPSALKIISYKVTVNSIEKRTLPPLDDEFVKNLEDENIETLEQFKEDLRKKLQQRVEERSETQLRNRLIDELLKENPFDVPEAMVNNYLDYIVRDMRRQYPKEKIDEEEIRHQYRVDAIHAIRWHLLMEKIIEVENIRMGDEEVFQKIDAMPYTEEQKEQLKADQSIINSLRRQLLEDKVIDFLKTHAEIQFVQPEAVAEKTAAPAKAETE